MSQPAPTGYCSRPGVLTDPALDPAARLLIGPEAELEGDDAPANAQGRLLLMEGGCGAVLARHAARFAETICQNSHFPDHASSQATAAKLGWAGVTCLLGDLPRAGGAPFPGRNAGTLSGEAELDSAVFPPRHFDQVIFRLGRGTALVNAALLEAFGLLRVGGSLTVCGHNQEGIKSFAKRAKGIFGNLNLLALKSSCRLLRFRKETETPREEIPDPRYFETSRLLLHVAGLPAAIEYQTKPGIFAYRETDPATVLLARHLPDCHGKDILDLGCGSGVLSVAAHRLGARSVVAVDSNAVAAACAVRNFREHGVRGRVACTFFTEGLDGRFDLVISNPPFHQGAETDFSLPGRVLDALLPHLRPEGKVLLVANQFLDYAREGGQRFGQVELLAREKGYQVFRMG